MTLDLSGYEPLAKEAVAHYWNTLERQGAKQREGEDPEGGNRSNVLGGKQMDGFCRLVRHALSAAGLTDGHIYQTEKLELPGFFRPTKKWDMLVVHEGTLLAAMEFKSQRGPSFGNNLNNRSEESVGTGHDFATAFREGAFGSPASKPWTGWVMLLEDCAESRNPVKLFEPHFKVFPEFRGTSYMQRYELLLRRLVREGLYNSVAFLVATKEGGPVGNSSNLPKI
jgi:hypothetical protein